MSNREMNLAGAEIEPPRQFRRFKRHSAYRDSGVAWLGEVPASWKIKPLKSLLAAPLKYGANEAAELDDPALPRYVRITDIGEHDSLRKDTFKSLPADIARDYLLQEGDILFARSGATAGKTFLYRRSWGTCAYAGYLIRARLDVAKARPDFIRYVTASAGYWQWVSSSLIQATIQNVSAERYANLYIPVPTLAEQEAISRFLDRETARIDDLIAKNEQLLALLREKRTAVISRAVTKGLNQNAAKKNSNIEWLGDIPRHWRVKRWRYNCHITNGQVAPNDDRYRDRIMIAPNHIESGTGRIIVTETADEQGAISGKYLVKPSDIIYSKIRPALSKACIATGEWLCSADMYPIRIVTDTLRPKFLLYYILSEGFVRLMVNESMRVAMPKVNRETLADSPLMIPPVAEQDRIVEFLDEQCIKIDTLAQHVEDAIRHLTEFRTALISAAVTGEIDVRDAA